MAVLLRLGVTKCTLLAVGAVFLTGCEDRTIDVNGALIDEYNNISATLFYRGNSAEVAIVYITDGESFYCPKGIYIGAMLPKEVSFNCSELPVGRELELEAVLAEDADEFLMRSAVMIE